MLKTKTHKGRWGRENLQRPLGALGWIPVSVFGVFGSGPYRPKEARARYLRVAPLGGAPAPARRARRRHLRGLHMPHKASFVVNWNTQMHGINQNNGPPRLRKASGLIFRYRNERVFNWCLAWHMMRQIL